MARRKRWYQVRHNQVEAVMVALALLSVGLLVLEFTVPLAEWAVHLFDVVDVVVACIFLGEFGVKLQLAKKPKKFFKKHWWELLAAIPISTPLTQSLRLVRLLRLIHLAQVARE